MSWTELSVSKNGSPTTWWRYGGISLTFELSSTRGMTPTLRLSLRGDGWESKYVDHSSSSEKLCNILLSVKRAIEGICTGRRMEGSWSSARWHSFCIFWYWNWSEILFVASGRLSHKEKESLWAFRVETERESPLSLCLRDSFSSASMEEWGASWD